MNVKKSLIGILFAVVFCFVLPLNVKAQAKDIEEEIKEQILQEYENNIEFARMQVSYIWSVKDGVYEEKAEIFVDDSFNYFL